jgi:SAM-dependent methyltransferase
MTDRQSGNPPPPLRMLGSPEQATGIFQSAIRGLASNSHPLAILEAGCGRQWPLDLSGVQYHLVGVDRDAAALRHRREEVRDLDDWVVGDLLSLDLPEETYDVIFNSFVLEHVQGAESLLDRFVRWLRPGGLLLLRLPDGNTVYGLLARCLPYRWHVAYYRYLRRSPGAGQPGHPPYPTYYDSVVSRQGILSYTRSRQLRVLEEFGTNFHLQAFGPLAGLALAGLRTVQAATGGRYEAGHQNLGYVIQKPATATQ